MIAVSKNSNLNLGSTGISLSTSAFQFNNSDSAPDAPVETPAKPDTTPEKDIPPAEPAPAPHEEPSEVPCETGPCKW